MNNFLHRANAPDNALLKFKIIKFINMITKIMIMFTRR